MVSRAAISIGEVAELAFGALKALQSSALADNDVVALALVPHTHVFCKSETFVVVGLAIASANRVEIQRAKHWSCYAHAEFTGIRTITFRKLAKKTWETG